MMKSVIAKGSSFGFIISVGIVFSLLYSSCKPTGSDGETVSLAEAYKDNFTIGVALSTRALDDSMSVQRALESFNSITAENSMKWEKIHPKPDAYDFVNSDKFVDFGLEHDMEIIGHVLIWHSQTPPWVFLDEHGDTVSRDVLLERMQSHISTVMERYKGKVKYWDVVNEAVADDGNFRQNIWAKIIGEDYVLKAFEYAREADPEAVLIYNDYSIATPHKRNGVIRLIKELQDNGVKVDVIGMQGHYHLDYPLLEDLEASIIAFSELGCKVHITELDINVLPNPFDSDLGADVRLNFEYDSVWNPWPDAMPDSMQNLLAERYVSFFEIFNKHKDIVDRVTFWGVQDGTSWLNYWPIFGRTNYPLLFDREYEPKKVYWELIRIAE